MKKLVKLSLLVVGVLAVVSTSALAGDLPARGPISFSYYDTNKDGTVSESEFNDVRAARISQKESQGLPMKNVANAPAFSELDTDHDGKLTNAELLEGQNKQMQKNRASAGSGQMGNNTKGIGRNAPTFESYDLDGDGFLTEKELDEARAKRIAQKASEGKMTRNSGNQTKFSEIDTNGDGKITKEEFLANQMKKRGSPVK